MNGGTGQERGEEGKGERKHVCGKGKELERIVCSTCSTLTSYRQVYGTVISLTLILVSHDLMVLQWGSGGKGLKEGGGEGRKVRIASRTW